MDQSVTALIIFCGLIAPMIGFAVAGWRRKNRQRTETDDLGRRLGAQWFTVDTGLPYGRVNEALTGNPYSDSNQLFDYAFATDYRGRQVLALEFTRVGRTAQGASQGTHHSIQLLGLPTPQLMVLPRLPTIRAEFWPSLTEVKLGNPDFDQRFMVLAKDAGTSATALRPEVLTWFSARPEGYATIITFAGDGLEVTTSGGLPGWDATGIINDLADLADLIQYAAVQPSPRLELKSQPPPGNGTLKAISGCVLAAALIFWLVAFTISNPSSGLVVIGIPVGLVVLVFLIALLAQRRKRR